MYKQTNHDNKDIQITKKDQLGTRKPQTIQQNMVWGAWRYGHEDRGNRHGKQENTNGKQANANGEQANMNKKSIEYE